MRYLIQNGTSGHVRIFSIRVRKGQERILTLAKDPRPHYRNKGLNITLLPDELPPEPPAPEAPVEEPEPVVVEEPEPEIVEEPEPPTDPDPTEEPPTDPVPEPEIVEEPPAPVPPKSKTKTRGGRRRATRSSKKG